MPGYTCPRADLGCDAEFASSADLDHHFRWTHGYRRVARYVWAWRPATLPPVGGREAQLAIARRHSARAAGTGAAPGFGPAATAGAARARREVAPTGGLLRRLTRRH
jgi:hypothetical protein